MRPVICDAYGATQEAVISGAVRLCRPPRALLKFRSDVIWRSVTYHSPPAHIRSTAGCAARPSTFRPETVLMTESELVSIESRAGVRLPQRYRDVVLNYPQALLDMAEVYPGRN